LSDFKNEDWYISNKYTQIKEKVKFIDNGIQFDINNNKFDKEDLYFIVSSKFNGNHVIIYFFFKFIFS